MFTIERTDGVATVYMRQGSANAIGPEFIEAMAAMVEEVRGSDVRGVVLTGYDKFFSAGLNLNSILGLGDPDGLQAFMSSFGTALLELFRLPAPVVAAINGHAVAGGCVLVQACDYRVMRSDLGKIGLNELEVGLPLPIPAYEMVRASVPSTSLREVVFEGRLYDAAEALERGLVDAVAPADEVLSVAQQWCARMASKPRKAFAAMKAMHRARNLERIERVIAHPEEDSFLETVFDEETLQTLMAAAARLGQKKG